MNKTAEGHLKNGYKALQKMEEHLEQLKMAPGEPEQYRAIIGLAECFEHAAARFRDAARAMEVPCPPREN